MSRDSQRSLGLEAAVQVYQQMPILPDSSPEAQYIQQIGHKLVAAIPQQYSWPFGFRVVAQKEIAGWPPEDYTGDTAAFQQMRQHAAGVRAFTGQEIARGAGQLAQLNQENGAAPNPNGPNSSPTKAPAAPQQAGPVAPQNVLPSSHMTMADLGPVKMLRPENWQVTLPKQEGQFVTVAPQAGVTNNGIGYGVLLNGVEASQLQGMNIDQMTSLLVQNMQKNNGLRQMRDPQKITVGSLEGRAVTLQSTSPFPDANGKQQTERDVLIVVPQRDSSLIFMIFVAPEPEFSQFEPTYQAMLTSVQFR